MTDTEKAPTSGFLRFWTSLPGVLTAVAAVITAFGGIYIASGSSSAATTLQPTPQVSTSAPAPQDPNIGVPNGSPIVIQDPANSPRPNQEAAAALFAACDQGDLNACSGLADIAERECNQGLIDSCIIFEQLTFLGLA